ncbi:MAG TPA: hypothetical protein PKN95_10785 [Verrucomicrobiota bacterium]|nr:hypothetical protein [Verrucomicrobiota bacterium]HNT15669.1 hypothetical protein [Verrucomicrobiota bacterium]
MTTITEQHDNKQLELGFRGLPRHSRLARRERRLARASWWFAKMRAMVNAASAEREAETPRPEQPVLPGTIRQIRLN